MKTIFAFFLTFTAYASAHFDKPHQDLDIPEDAKFVNIVYGFKNDTDEPIKFVGVMADCDCVQVEIIPADAAKDGFQPGEAGALQVVMHVERKINRSSLYVQFQNGEMVDTFKVTARLNRLPRVVLSSDKLYVAPDRADAFHRVKSVSGSLAAYRLRFDEKAVEARIENDFLLIRRLRKGLRREFVEIVDTKDGKDLVVGMLEMNFADER